MVITMAKLRMAHASTHGARKPSGPIFVFVLISIFIRCSAAKCLVVFLYLVPVLVVERGCVDSLATHFGSLLCHFLSVCAQLLICRHFLVSHQVFFQGFFRQGVRNDLLVSLEEVLEDLLKTGRFEFRHAD